MSPGRRNSSRRKKLGPTRIRPFPMVVRIQAMGRRGGGWSFAPCAAPAFASPARLFITDSRPLQTAPREEVLEVWAALESQRAHRMSPGKQTGEGDREREKRSLAVFVMQGTVLCFTQREGKEEATLGAGKKIHFRPRHSITLLLSTWHKQAGRASHILFSRWPLLQTSGPLQ